MKKLLQSLFLLLFITFQVVAQERTVTGTVTDKSDGLPLPGVSIQVTGTQIGTQTDANGKFSLRIPGANNSLTFTYIGYSTQTSIIPSGNVLNVSLTQDARQLGEVVVTALGIERSRNQLPYAV